MLWILLVGCNPLCGLDDACRDADGDGFPQTVDCDDRDPARNPGLIEIADDGLDNDCDPDTSDLDPDGDGFNTPGDCDQNDALVHDGAREIWYDGVDQNCDGHSDFDQDFDGADALAYGGADCDDLTPSVGPEAEEVCDGVDNDCDGMIEVPLEGDRGVQAVDPEVYLSLAVQSAASDQGLLVVADQAGTVWWDTFDADWTGEALGSGHQVDLWEGLAAWASEDGVYTPEGSVMGEGLVVTVGPALGGGTQPSVAIGAPLEGPNKTGAIYVFHDGLQGAQSLDEADAVLVGKVEEDFAGGLVERGGNLNGDGFPDLLTGAPLGGLDDKGRVYGLLGPISGERPLEFERLVGGLDSQEGLGTDMAAADLDFDGYDELIAANAQGEVLVFAGPMKVFVQSDAAVARIEATEGALASAGDANCDGYEDLWIGPHLTLGGPLDGGVFEQEDLILTGVDGTLIQGLGDTDGDLYGETLFAGPGGVWLVGAGGL